MVFLSFRLASQRSVLSRYTMVRWQSNGRELLVEHHKDHYITILKLNRPKVNALGKQLINELSLALDDLEKQCADDETTIETRCVILTSQIPNIFCAGADLKERALMATQLEKVETTVTNLRTTFHRLASLPIPTIAAIEGAAFGGGMELASAVDIRIASQSAIFGLPETTLGILPGAGGTQRCSRLLGISRTIDLITTGRKFDSRMAYEYGLIQHLVEPGRADDKAWKIAKQIAKNAPIAVRAAKDAIQRGVVASTMEEALEIERECYARTLATQDRLEGLAAFREGRNPEYKGN